MSHKASHQPASPVRPHGKGTFEGTFDSYQLFIGGPHNDQAFATGLKNISLGRRGDDKLSGGANQDELIGMDGNDYLDGGDDMDHLIGGRGDDTLIGGAAGDTLLGGDGNDTLIEGAGHSDIEGGRGNDMLTGDSGADAFVISPDSGNDVVTDFQAGPGMFDHLAIMGLQPEDLRLADTEGGVMVSWSTAEGTGSVLLQGLKIADLAQDDFMFADDRYLITGITDDGRLMAQGFEKDEGFNLSAAPASGNDKGTFERNVEDYHLKFGTAKSEVFQATDKNDLYFGLRGDDRLYGGAGDDHLAGDAGNDVLDGATGSDDLRGGAGDDQLFGSDEADNLMGEDGTDTLYAGDGHDMLHGGAGNDWLNGGDGADAYIVSTTSGNDVVSGGFDAGPGAFDHIAFLDLGPDQIIVEDVTSAEAPGHAGVLDAHEGVLVSWETGSIFLEGITKSQMAQDDFMFFADMGNQGTFENDPEITTEGSHLIAADWLLV